MGEGGPGLRAVVGGKAVSPQEKGMMLDRLGLGKGVPCLFEAPGDEASRRPKGEAVGVKTGTGRHRIVNQIDGGVVENERGNAGKILRW